MAPAARAAARAARIASGGISQETRTTSPGPIASARRAAVTDAGVGDAFAPGATAIRFSARSSTTIRATPVGRGATSRWVTSIPSATRAARAATPKSSSPTAPTNATSAPSRAAATAWLPPLPP